jgi:NAD(P)-dependent dehydrogenase (short-subunit alcohol dehydrogenase family)
MNPSDFQLDGRVCVVTGGGRGIGRAIAERLAAAGGLVVVAGRTRETLDDAVRAIAQAGGTAHAQICDVSREDEVVRLAEEVKARFGAAQVLVNNAGINPIYKTIERTTLEEWSNIIGANLTGVFLACREFGRQMLEARRGSIVNITSIGGRVGLVKSGPYCAAKGGVELLTKTLALDWAKTGVRVNTVAPAFIETDLTSRMRGHEALSSRLIGRTPMGRFGVSEEVAGAVLYLACDASSYVTGQTIGVDGGWTAG